MSAAHARPQIQGLIQDEPPPPPPSQLYRKNNSNSTSNHLNTNTTFVCNEATNKRRNNNNNYNNENEDEQQASVAIQLGCDNDPEPGQVPADWSQVPALSSGSNNSNQASHRPQPEVGPTQRKAAAAAAAAAVGATTIECPFEPNESVLGEQQHQSSNATDKEQSGRRPMKGRFFCNPSDSLCYWWSAVVSLAFLYNFWSLSYRFAFREIDLSTCYIWFAFDYTADAIYAMDILINFRTGFLEDGVLQRDTKKIGAHYQESTLFYLDAACLLPFDILYLSFGFCSIFRCNRLVKIHKFWSFVDRSERHTNYPNVFRTFTLVHYILAIFHWNACLFHMISKLKIIDIKTLYKLEDNNQCDDISCQYLHAFYWSTLALTIIGDLPRPRTRGEHIYVIVELLFGLFLFASVLGHVANIVTNVSAARKEFQAKLDAVKTFMRTRRVSDDLQSKVIRWFDYLWISQKSSDEERSVACLPDRLKAEIAIHVNLDTLKRVDIFQATEAGFLRELVLRLKPVLFSPGDYVCRKDEAGHEMYIVSRGILEVVTNEGQTVVATFRAGSYFGEIAVLNVGSAGNKRTASVRSVGYSDLFCLSKQDLWDVLKDYPNAESRIRAVAEERLSALGGGGAARAALAQRTLNSTSSSMARRPPWPSKRCGGGGSGALCRHHSDSLESLAPPIRRRVYSSASSYCKLTNPNGSNSNNNVNRKHRLSSHTMEPICAAFTPGLDGRPLPACWCHSMANVCAHHGGLIVPPPPPPPPPSVQPMRQLAAACEYCLLATAHCHHQMAAPSVACAHNNLSPDATRRAKTNRSRVSQRGLGARQPEGSMYPAPRRQHLSVYDPGSRQRPAPSLGQSRSFECTPTPMELPGELDRRRHLSGAHTPTTTQTAATTPSGHSTSATDQARPPLMRMSEAGPARAHTYATIGLSSQQQQQQQQNSPGASIDSSTPSGCTGGVSGRRQQQLPPEPEPISQLGGLSTIRRRATELADDHDHGYDEDLVDYDYDGDGDEIDEMDEQQQQQQHADDEARCRHMRERRKRGRQLGTAREEQEACEARPPLGLMAASLSAATLTSKKPYGYKSAEQQQQHKPRTPAAPTPSSSVFHAINPIESAPAPARAPAELQQPRLEWPPSPPEQQQQQHEEEQEQLVVARCRQHLNSCVASPQWEDLEGAPSPCEHPYASEREEQGVESMGCQIEMADSEAEQLARSL